DVAGDTEYGTLKVNTNGTFTFELDGGNSKVQGLKAGETLTEAVTYTVEDSEGATSTATLNIAIHGSQPIEPPTTPDYIVLEGGAGAVTQAQLARTTTGADYTLTDLPDHGRLLLNGVEMDLGANSTFTSADI